MSMTDRRAIRGGRIRSSQDLAAGVFLLFIAAIALWQGADLSAGRLGQIGPGLFPRALAALVGLLGIGIALGSLRFAGEHLTGWSIRGPVFVVAAIVLFGLTVRPLGLAVAAPLAFIIGALASPETRLVEAVLFAVVLTVFCLMLFIFALGLPIPVAPWLIDR